MTVLMEDRIRGAINSIDDAIQGHKSGGSAPLSLKILTQLKSDMQKMLDHIKARDYAPSYPRFLIDWPGDEEFVQQMVKLAYDYKRKVA
jgi:hypothetical protein